MKRDLMASLEKAGENQAHPRGQRISNTWASKRETWRNDLSMSDATLR